MMERQVPYLHTLRSIRSAAETEYDDPNFPTDYCGIMAKTVVKIIRGLRRVGGSFIQDGKPEGHAWCYDPKRKIWIDLAADQFDRTLPGVLITKVGDPRYQPSIRTTWAIRMPTPITTLLMGDLTNTSIIKAHQKGFVTHI